MQNNAKLQPKAYITIIRYLILKGGALNPRDGQLYEPMTDSRPNTQLSNPTEEENMPYAIRTFPTMTESGNLPRKPGSQEARQTID
jgi:hypothetical protein